MDFQEFVDSYSMAAAVLSVEKLGEEHWGEIRIVKANAMYKKIMGSNYKDGMRYDELVQKEANFEDFLPYLSNEVVFSWVDWNS